MCFQITLRSKEEYFQTAMTEEPYACREFSLSAPHKAPDDPAIVKALSMPLAQSQVTLHGLALGCLSHCLDTYPHARPFPLVSSVIKQQPTTVD